MHCYWQRSVSSLRYAAFGMTDIFFVLEGLVVGKAANHSSIPIVHCHSDHREESLASCSTIGNAQCHSVSPFWYKFAPHFRIALFDLRLLTHSILSYRPIRYEAIAPFDTGLSNGLIRNIAPRGWRRFVTISVRNLCLIKKSHNSFLDYS